MRARSLILIAATLISLAADAGPRRRAVGKPTADVSPAAWLTRNASVLESSELVPYSFDLEPLRPMIGAAGIVAIGDGTHGTREFYTMKLRVIEFMVREMGFDVVAFEAPFPVMNRVNTYAQGGAGDAYELIGELRDLNYFFWDAEELVDVVEWMREYNAHRGERPPVHIAGFDVFAPVDASQEVLKYLRSLDPAAATVAEGEYSCILPDAFTISGACIDAATRVHDALASREAELAALSSAAAFHDALHNARVVVQSGSANSVRRDDSMAANTLWLREHRGTSRKMILWAHNAHVSKAANEWARERPMGKTLAATLGNDLFVIATMTAAGSFRQWDPGASTHKITTFPPLQPTSIESSIRQRGMPRLLIPLRGVLPMWLSNKAPYNSAAGSGAPGLTESLPEHYDAAIFIDTTTPLTALP